MRKQKEKVELTEQKVAASAVDYSINPKFRSKIGAFGLIIHLLILAVGGFSVYFGVNDFVNPEGRKFLSILFLAMGGIIFVYGFTALFDTYYRFDEDGLYVKYGMMKNKYSYKFMMKMESNHKLFTYNCLSMDKRCITYRDNQNGTAQFHISPKNEEEFIKELKKHCKSLKIEK